MPNHLHALIAFRHTDKPINSIIGNGKRFMAYDLVNRLTETSHHNLLLELALSIVPTEKRRGKLHDVFEPSFDWKECYSDKFIEQKLNYIHENPCRGKWDLVKQPWEYVHSSAKFYSSSEQGEYPVTNYMMWCTAQKRRVPEAGDSAGTEAMDTLATIVVDRIVVSPSFDKKLSLFVFPKIDNRIFISSDLKEELSNSGVTGIEFTEAPL